MSDKRSKLEEHKIELNKQLLSIREERDMLGQQIHNISTNINAINNKIEAYKKFKVSDHAIVRYLERVKGLDIKAIIEEICPQHLIDSIVEFGDCEFKHNNTYLKIVNNTVVTVLNKEI